MSTVLVIGSTGQVGRVVVEEALGCGFAVRAQSRNAARAQRSLPGGVEVVEASPSSADDLRSVVAGVDAVVLTHGGDMDGEGGSSFYAAIPALLDALGG
ncbi:NAD(P)H-binding protein [Actinomyces sp. oral taxon 448]|jgi:NAD-dependent epimerase/dehydratase|uniref:NAD(P)H-binding protein n=1 Tax=Actinomyces sp. oral taxon 448 TaxID=712124 RepID=UPI0025BD84EE|nr:NAD(P)H-binding protein [Actinomyces sp. oral taxon 448]